MHPDRQRLLLWSIPVATLTIFFTLGWNQGRMRGDAQQPKDPVAEVQAILLETLEVAGRIPYAFERDRVLLGVAAGFAQAGETGAALRVATRVTKAPLRAQAFFLVVHALARDGKIEQAGNVLPHIRSPDLHAGAAALVMAAQVRAGNPDEALHLYESIPPSRHRRRVWEYVAARRPGPDAIGPVVQMIGGLGDTEERDWALAGIARGLAKRGRIRRALELAERISSEQARASALWGVAGGQARAGDLGGALLTSSDLPPQQEAKVAAVSEIAKAYVASGDTEGALNMADMVADAGERACVLRAVAVTQAASGDGGAGFRTSLHIAEAAERSRAQVEVARGQAAGGDVAGALKLAATIREEAPRSRAMGEVAVAQVSAGGFEGAMRTLARLPQPRGVKAVVYSELAAVRARAGRTDEAAAVAGEFRKAAEQALVLLGAARGLLERAHRIEVHNLEVACGVPSRTVDLLLRPVTMERLVERVYAPS